MKEKCTKQQKKNKRRQKGAMGAKATAKGWELNNFFCAFKLDFLQLICKACLIFKSSLELTLLITLKQRELYESRHVSEEWRCLKIWDFWYAPKSKFQIDDRFRQCS